ncbi:MAG: Crp/Fnr family transcriptional regulator [Flavobacteriia bacterium]|nr:Crp/Fnr family transcriptional regulator [Flavobacteriia bacterium]
MNYTNKSFSLGYVNTLFLSERIEVKEGEFLFHEGDLNNFVFFIIEGRIKVVKKKIVIGFTKENEFVGITSCLCENDHYYFSALACEDSILLKIHKAVFKKALSDNPEFGKIMIEILCERIKLTDNKTKSFMNHTSTERVVNEILNHITNERLSCQLTPEDLSELTGVSKKLIQSIFKELAAKKLIKIIPHTIEILDLNQLEIIGKIV